MTWTSTLSLTTTMTISKLTQHNQFPTRSLNQFPCLERCNWSITSVFACRKSCDGLVNAPRRWYHRVATELPNMGSEESLMEGCLWTFRDENGVIHALCLVYVDDFMLACSDSPFGKRIFDGTNTLYEWGTWKFDISFAAYVSSEKSARGFYTI